MYESTEALEILTSIVLNLAFPYNTILPCFFVFFLIIDLYFLIPAVITQIFTVAAELAIPTGTPTNEASEEIEAQLVTVEVRISKCSR